MSGAFGIDVPGGNPAVLEDAASELRGSAGAFDRAAATLRDPGTAGWWVGTASLAFEGRCADTAEGMDASGTALHLAGGVVADAASELEDAKRAAERAVEEATHADDRRKRAQRAYDAARLEAGTARMEAATLRTQADIAALSGTPAPALEAAHDDQLAAAGRADERAQDALVARGRAEDDLHDAQIAGRKAVRHYEHVAEAAAGRLAALVGILPQAQGLTSIPAGYTGGPGAPAPVAPMGTSAAPPPPERKDEGGGIGGFLAEVSGLSDAKQFVSAVGRGDLGGALEHGFFAIPVGPGKLGKAGRVAKLFKRGEEAKDAATGARAVTAVDRTAVRVRPNLAIRAPDGRLIMRSDADGRIIPPTREEVRGVQGYLGEVDLKARQQLDKLESTARQATGKVPVQTKKQAAIETARLILDHLDGT